MSLSYEITNWENGKTVLKAEHLRKIEKGITDIISENDAIYKDEDTRKSNEKQRQEEHSRKMNEASEVISDIQKDYDSLQKIIIDENTSANLQNQINQTNSQLEHIEKKNDNTFINVKYPPHPYISAKGDGVTDDTEAIQTLLDNFNNIFIPDGVFIISTLNLTRSNHIYGNGKQSSILKGNSEGVNIINCICDSQGYEMYKINDLTIDGGYKSENGIYIKRTENSIHDCWANIQNIFIKNCKGDGIFLGYKIRECYIDTLEIRDCGGNGVTLEEGATDNVITNVVSHNNEKSGFYINGANNRFVACKAFWNGRNNNAEEEYRYSGFYITSWANKLTCCDSQENALHGFHIANTNNIQLDCITGDRNGLPLTDWRNDSPATTYGSGVYIDNSKLVNVSGLVRDFLKWTKGQTQKYGITVTNSSSEIDINLMTQDLEINANINSDTNNYSLKINGREYFHKKTKASYINNNNYIRHTDEISRMGIDVYSDNSQFQIYSNNNNELKIDSFNKNSNGDYQWTGTPIKINNVGDVHIGRHNTKIGFFDVEGINRIQAPTSANNLDSVITLANELRSILIKYGLLG